MAPSVAETVTTTVDHASNGIAKLNLKQEKPIESTKKDVSSKYLLKLCIFHDRCSTARALLSILLSIL